MAEFQGIFCHPFLPSVLIIERVGGMGSGAGWGWAVGQGGVGWGGAGGEGGGKNHPLGYSMSSHDAHTVANNTPWATQPVGANTGPHCSIGALHGSHCSSHDSGGLEKYP